MKHVVGIGFIDCMYTLRKKVQLGTLFPRI